MTDRPETIYTLYPVFKASPALRTELSDADDRRDAVQEIENLDKAWEGRVDVRGSYSTVGFRADADLMRWLVASSPQDLQRYVVELRRTRAGRLLDLSWSFMGAVKPAEFTPDHQPEFVKGTPPETFLCVYPFVRTPEWYLLPSEERSELLREHGMLGREFPEALASRLAAGARRKASLYDIESHVRALETLYARIACAGTVPYGEPKPA